MIDASSMCDVLLEAFKKLLYPEEWIELDMSFSKSELLAMLLIDKHGEIIMGQVADYVNVPMSTATGIIERLVKNGYALRERSEADRRIVTIKLTDAGKSTVAKFRGTIAIYMDQIAAALTEEEKDLIFKLFIKIVSILNNKEYGKPVPSAQME